jgi:hypothetical protein
MISTGTSKERRRIGSGFPTAIQVFVRNNRIRVIIIIKIHEYFLTGNVLAIALFSYFGGGLL